MDHSRVYSYRFKNVDRQKKLLTWKIIAGFLYKELDRPASVIDPAAGDCEFINAFPATVKWAIDLDGASLEQHAGSGVHAVTGNSLETELPADFFDAAFISNFLEHLDSREDISLLLTRIHRSLRPGGRIAVMGPNFKYCAKEYFDFADHKIILTHKGLEEHLYGTGFSIIRVIPRFLPLSFRGRLPVNRLILNTYFAFPILWRFFGKQFLIIAEK